MAGLEDKKLPEIPKKNDSLGGDSGLENLVPSQPFVKSGNDSLGGPSGLDKLPTPTNGLPNRQFNGDGLAK